MTEEIEMKYNMILFDLDGTLVDTLKAIEKTVNSCLEEMELETYLPDHINGLIGHGVAGIVDKIFAMRNYDEREVNRQIMAETIRKYYGKYYNYNVRLYEGIDSLLDFLKENNIKMGIVTNKDHSLAIQTVRENLSLWDFTDIIGADDNRHPRKPDPYGIDKISGETGIPKNSILYVGDMEADLKTAENAGVDIVYCNWGFGNAKGETGIPEEIKVNSVQEIISKIKEIKQ